MNQSQGGKLRAVERVTGDLSCCWCRENIGPEPWRCEGCGVVLHLDCAREAPRCPSLGCGASTPPPSTSCADCDSEITAGSWLCKRCGRARHPECALLGPCRGPGCSRAPLSQRRRDLQTRIARGVERARRGRERRAREREAHRQPARPRPALDAAPRPVHSGHSRDRSRPRPSATGVLLVNVPIYLIGFGLPALALGLVGAAHYETLGLWFPAALLLLAALAAAACAYRTMRKELGEP